MELRPPFSYLKQLSSSLVGGENSCTGAEKTKTSISVGECSVYVASGTPDKNYTEQVILADDILQQIVFPQKKRLLQLVEEFSS